MISRSKNMSKFKAPFSKYLNQTGQLKTRQQELPPLKIGKAQILTPGTRKKILKRLALNIKTKAETVSPVSPGISLSVLFDSQPDTTTAVSSTEVQSQIDDVVVESGEEFDLELSPSKDILDQQNPSSKRHVPISDKNKEVDVNHESVQDTKILAKEVETKQQINGESAKQSKIPNQANFQLDQSLAMDKNLQFRMPIAEPQEKSDCDHLHQSDFIDKLQDGENQKKKVQKIEKSTLKVKPLQPKFKKKEKKHSSDKSQNTVNQKTKNKLPLPKVKGKTEAQEPMDKPMLDRKKRVKNSKRFMKLKVKNLQSAPFEALNIDRNKPKRKKASERNRSKKEIKEDVMKMIQKMHREIVQLLNRRTRMLKAQEKTSILYSGTATAEE